MFERILRKMSRDQLKDEKMPKWLNEDLIEKVIRSFKNDQSIEIVNFKQGSGFDEHYGSQMYCLTISFKSQKYQQNEELKVVIKANPEKEEQLGEILGENPFVATEIKMYKKTIPLINDLMRRSGMKCDFAPE